MGGRGIAPLILNLSAMWGWVVSFTPLPRYLWERTRCPLSRRLGGTPEQVRTFWKRETFLAGI